MSELELTFGTEPLVAWRWWNHGPVEMRDGRLEQRLFSLYQPGFWPPRSRYQASCRQRHEPPWPDHHCGVWAVREREDLEAVRPPIGAPLVAGTVALWGRVLEFEQGYRAEAAYPLALSLNDADAAAELAAVYAVDAEPTPLPLPVSRGFIRIPTAELSFRLPDGRAATHMVPATDEAPAEYVFEKSVNALRTYLRNQGVFPPEPELQPGDPEIVRPIGGYWS